MSYRDHLASHLRLTILRILAEAPSCKANSSILTDAADALGVPATRDQVRAEIAWLEEQRLVTSEQSLPGLVVATVTERGLDVAAGRATVPGVQRPTPRG